MRELYRQCVTLRSGKANTNDLLRQSFGGTTANGVHYRGVNCSMSHPAQRKPYNELLSTRLGTTTAVIVNESEV